MKMNHTPVMLNQVIETLAINPNGIYIDMTFGRGGHSSAILSKLNQGRLIAFDLDISAIEVGLKLKEQYQDKFDIIHDNFKNMAQHLEKRHIQHVDGIICDLGVSSPQFDDLSRGFSYKGEAKLDMRMNRQSPLDAYEVVNYYSLTKLTSLLREYGDEPDAYQIAKAIIQYRQQAPIETNEQLVMIIKSVKSQATLKKKGHPAKQTFQALRIEVNDELNNLKAGLASGLKLLAKNGIFIVLSFHSGEDKIVKQMFQAVSKTIGTRKAPLAHLIPNDPQYQLVHKKVIVATSEEVNKNHRAISAKMRAIIRKEVC